MEGRRVTFRLREDVAIEKQILEWLESVRADSNVALRVYLVPVIARGLGLTNGGGGKATQKPVEAEAPRAPRKRRAPPTTTADVQGSDANGYSPVKAGENEAFPMDRLEFD